MSIAFERWNAILGIEQQALGGDHCYNRIPDLAPLHRDRGEEEEQLMVPGVTAT